MTVVQAVLQADLFHSITMPSGATQASGLTPGTDLPDWPGTPAPEIINLQIGPMQESPETLVATVQAFLADFWEASPSGSLRELGNSRIMQKTADAITLLRRYEVDDDALTSPDPLPQLGEDYPSGAYPSDWLTVAPSVAKIEMDPKYTPTKTLVTVTYSGYLKWGDVAG